MAVNTPTVAQPVANLIGNFDDDLDPNGKGSLNAVMRAKLDALAALMGGAGAAIATIPFNPAANISNAIDVTNHFPGGFHVVAVPSSGHLSLSVSCDAGAHYGLLNMDGAQVIIAAVAAKYYGLGSYAGSLQGVTHIKFVNVDATGTAANQATADATIIVSRA